MNYISVGGWKIPHFTTSAAVVGTGAAGYNAADSLYSLGVTDVLIITEGRMMGTSRNTGSDKQTYYKLNLSGGVKDSVYDMAKALMRGGSMHGDIALTDAALSARGFFKLVGLGVPFPMNEYGEYVGYKTDHDETTRATSCGPLTSKYMTEALERTVFVKGIPVYDRHRVIRILTENGEAKGLLTLCPLEANEENPMGLCLFSAGAVVYAVGGPSAIYADTVYPPSQTCSMGAAFAAGALGANLTESQYGLASVDFRWNLSGTYQQVLPRYISTDENGEDEREFLREAFESDEEMLHAIFSKGYEWPFDPKKTVVGGSSRVDLAVFREKQRGRRVFLDYRRNPSAVDDNGALRVEKLSEKAREYLTNSNALLPTPIERLEKMNRPAIDLYASHGIDLYRERLEIAVCAQHCNGGLAVKNTRESVSLENFYAVGECAGTFGVYRPGGSALNSTQTGSLFAAIAIAKKKKAFALPSEAVLSDISEEIKTLFGMTGGDLSRNEILSRREEMGKRMSACAAFLRNEEKLRLAFDECREELLHFEKDYRLRDASCVADAMINRDILQTQLVYFGAILDYIADGGKSRGSYLLVRDGDGDLLSAVPEIDTAHAAFVQNTAFGRDLTVKSFFEPVRPLPESDQWFENVWNRFRKEQSFF
ncbi:MAG: FAD-binding protein [Clostridia bacterium]|nr:FAD-binding protein [Clostridia bacterium]